MVNNVDRIAQDRKLIETKPQDQSLIVLIHSDKKQNCTVLVKILGSLVANEGYSHDKDIYPDYCELYTFVDNNCEEIDKHLDPASTAFMGLLLSQQVLVAITD